VIFFVFGFDFLFFYFLTNMYHHPQSKIVFQQLFDATKNALTMIYSRRYYSVKKEPIKDALADIVSNYYSRINLGVYQELSHMLSVICDYNFDDSTIDDEFRHRFIDAYARINALSSALLCDH
jgi:hypothetical protein